jgi:hypothetical protein
MLDELVNMPEVEKVEEDPLAKVPFPAFLIDLGFC